MIQVDFRNVNVQLLKTAVKEMNLMFEKHFPLKTHNLTFASHQPIRVENKFTSPRSI